MAASKRFGRYKDEAGKAVREAQVTGNPVSGELLKVFARCLENEEARKYFFMVYEHAKGFLRMSGMSWSAKDVEHLAPRMGGCPNYQEDSAGEFLSALINLSEGSSFRIPTHGFRGNVGYLGYINDKEIIVQGDIDAILGVRNRGRITVEGSTIGDVGEWMKSGSILIKGDAMGLYEYRSRCIGKCLRSGSITVRGDAVDLEIGTGMKGGRITIDGDVRRKDGSTEHIMGDGTRIDLRPKVGDGMSGGEIHINGEIGRIGEVEGGRIYHRGKLIVDR